jgi:Na+-transporting NADH:ubiquinone oxidoreductase subunit A
MKTIRVKRGYDLKLVGSPSEESIRLDSPTRLALLPEHIPFVKPRLKIEKGDTVALGSELIEDKRNTDIRFLSPGGGRVADIQFGPRRVIREIVIELDETEKAVEFQRFQEEDIEKTSREHLVQALVTGGLWPLIKELPFRDYPRADVVPPALFVTLGRLEPFQPRPQRYLDGNEALFEYGLKVLRKLAEDRVHVCAHVADTEPGSPLNGWANLAYAGKYPAHDPGVLLYHTKSSPQENRCWFIDGQDVLLIARLLKDGVYPTERVVSLGGAGMRRRCHAITRMGAPLSHIAADRIEDGNWRFIEGGVLTGYPAPARSYLGLGETALNLLPEGDRKGELLGLFDPGYRKPTFSRAFLSATNNEDLDMDCNMHGGERACIACGYCALVCPVDILPQFTYKAILAGEVEESLDHGLLDCVECALCSYVCPSKIELFETLKNAKAEFYREQAGR